MDTVQDKWLGPIKSSWRRPKIGTLGINVNTKNNEMKESNLLTLSYGRIKRKNIQTNEGLLPASFETYQIVETGDIIFRFTDLQNDKRSLRSALVEERGIITSAYVNFRPNPDQVNSVYFAYLMRALDLRKAFYEMGSGVRQTLKFEELASVPIPLPPLKAQRAIADYLNRETNEIDAMLDKLDELGRLLEERRALSIANSVNDSEKRYYRIAIQTLGLINSGDSIPAEKINNEGSYPVYGGNGLRGFAESYNQSGTKILIGRQGALCGNVHMASGKYWASEHALIITPNIEFNPKWLLYVLRNEELGGLSTSAAQPGITASAVGRQKIPFPPITEQERIVAALDEATAGIDAMFAKAQELKDLLVERRSALITAAVTGQIEVN